MTIDRNALLTMSQQAQAMQEGLRLSVAMDVLRLPRFEVDDYKPLRDAAIPIIMEVLTQPKGSVS